MLHKSNRLGLKQMLRIGTRFLAKECATFLSLHSRLNLFLPPNLVDIQLTKRCNLKCLQCDIWKTEKATELSLSQWKEIILDIKSCVGPFFLRFYGGEPFLRQDLFDLFGFCRDNGIETLITTNATLIDKRAADLLAASGVRLVQVSLDGARSQTHDKLRGVAGTFSKAMNAVDLLHGRVPLQINSTIMEDNLDEIWDLVDWAEKRHIKISLQGLLSIATAGDRKKSLDKMHPLFPRSKSRIDDLFERLLKKKKSSSFILNSAYQLQRMHLFYRNAGGLKKRYCEAIGYRLLVKSDGDLAFCSFSPPLGNLSQASLKIIWKSGNAAEALRQMKQCPSVNCLVLRGCYKETLFESAQKLKNMFVCPAA